jgi:hypothetical protein
VAGNLLRSRTRIGMNQRAPAVVTLLVMLLISTLAGADGPKRVSGQGGFPLTDSVTSMWSAEYNRKTQLLRVFEKEFPTTESNVVMVQNVDDPERRQFVGLGRVELNVPADANPAIYILERYEDIRNAVLPKDK